MNRLKEKLLQRKISLGLTAAQMCDRLSISEGTWSLLMSGQRGIGVEVLGKIKTAFPDLDQDVLDYLSEVAVSK